MISPFDYYKNRSFIDKAALFILLLICSGVLLGGCAGLMLDERERALDQSFEEGKISKSDYLSSKSQIEQERTRNSSSAQPDTK